jgi:probable F420-dependent oxidoreductase
VRFGINFPHAIGTDPVAIRDYVQAAEGAGFDYLLMIDHVAGIGRERFGADGPAFNYTSETPTHELMTTLAFIAGVTERLELVPSVLLLPQRPTVLAAKQAAEIAILSKGRLRLPLGIGWNYLEYDVLGADFHNRGRRLEEQIEVMKLLWTQPLVTFKGRWHDLDQVCLNPLPGGPIPIWIGGGAEDRLLQRYVRYADGWMPLLMPSVDVEDAIRRLRGHLAAAGRDPASFGLDVRLGVGSGSAADWVAGARRWQSLGATHIVINAGGPGAPPRSPAEALKLASEARKPIAEAVG